MSIQPLFDLEHQESRSTGSACRSLSSRLNCYSGLPGHPPEANMLRILLSSLLLFVVPSFAVFAHDVWINRGTYKNAAGEWCCGARDCGVVSPSAVKAGIGGYSLRGTVTYGKVVTGNEADGPTRQEYVNEVVPYSQSLPSPDGAYWRCKRPDGSPRCFFAPPPGS